MPWTSTTPFIIWAVVFIALTLILFKVKIRDRITPVLLLVDYLLINLYFFLAVNAALVVFWLRYLPFVALFFLAIRLLDRFHRKPWLPPASWERIAMLVLVLVLAGAGWVNKRVLDSREYPKEPLKPVMLAFPLQTGMYVITNGGSPQGVGMSDVTQDWLGRPTNAPQALTYGVDMMEMTSRGMLAGSILSDNRNSYEGWNDPVRAPCPGTVVAFETGHPDRKPNEKLDGFELGNYVVIQCFEYYVTISSLQNNFTPVAVGEQVFFDRILGYVGSSGAPSLPHVHVHVTVGGWGLDATPVPIEFEEKFMVRNMVFIR